MLPAKALRADTSKAMHANQKTMMLVGGDYGPSHDSKWSPRLCYQRLVGMHPRDTQMKEGRAIG